MNTYSKALRHISMRDVKQKHQQKLTEQKIQEEVREKEKQYIKSVMETKKFDWRKEIEQVDNKVKEEVIVNTVDDFGYDWRGELVRDRSKYFETGSLEEGMTSKDFEYLYGLSITNLQIDSSLGRVQNNNAQEIVQASSEYSEYQFGDAFPGSFINSIGDNQIISQSKVDALAFLDTTYGNVSGSDNRFTLTTGPEGFPPTGQSPPGSVVSTTNLQTALGVTLPAGVPNGNLGGTPIEGSAIKRVFTKAEPGKRINFNWQFASSEDALGAGSVDDYAFVAIKGTVTKFVSVLTKGLTYAGQFIYTVQPEDIVDGKVEIGIGVMDVFDPYVQTALTISNFGTFWAAGSLGSTTDAADLGMSVAAGMPQSQQKKKSEEPYSLPGYMNVQGGGQQITKTYPNSTPTPGTQTPQTFQTPQTSQITSISPLMNLQNMISKQGGAFAVGYLTGMEKNFPQEFKQVMNAVPGLKTLYDKMQNFEKVAKNLTQSGIKNKNMSQLDLAMKYNTAAIEVMGQISDKLSGIKTPKPSSTPPKPTQPKPQLDKYGRQIGTPLPPGVQQDMEKGGKTASPVGDAAIMAAAAALLKGGFKGGASSTETGLQLPAKGSAEWTRMAKEYTRANPGQYNPFMTNAQNQLMQKYGVGTNAMPLKSLKNSYQPQGEVISEKSSPKRLKTVQQALYPGQPSPNGFPDTPPPEMVNGYHPDYGQKDNMYNTLDKTSADSMPLTGNGKIDKKIKAARKQSK